ncbi:restriction endonuclease subunit S [uncultured Umboniibacter sp.]|uniref:restriction endonuclease subunit S n=1 Tax=uncultured Umboniibacter sp. TaxID=1798917 RepID=UPI00261E0E49|nr:restriction endonuclease subunit S [uncultured Umboniibacter sp.]
MSDIKITDIVDFNPKRVVKKGEIAPFVDMAALPVDSRDISEIGEREFKGSGSKFVNGDTLFARITPCLENGKTAKVSGLPEGVAASGSTEFIVMAAKEPDYDEDYVYYLARLPEFRSYAQARMEGTSGRQRVPWQSLVEFEYSFPDKEKRKEIGAFLKKIDDKIELNRQTNQTLEHIAQAIFKSWFVDFEPTRAKIAAKQAGQDPERAAMAAISGKSLAELDQLSPEQQEELKATAAQFPDALVDSELGEIPEGWAAKPFGELLSKTIGGDWGKEEPDEKHTEKVKILRGTDLPNVHAGSDDRVPTRYVTAKKLATRKLEAGDIVIEVSGGSPTQPTGRSLYLTQEIISRLNADLEPASFCRLFRPVESEVGLILGLHLQKIYDEGKTWLYQNTSTGISNFQTKVFLGKELVVVPSVELNKHFYDFAMPYLQKMSSNENKTLVELRDALLPKLLSGDLAIGNEDKEVLHG